MNEDQRAEPQYGERIPYLVVYRGLDKKLMDCVVSPDEYLKDRHVLKYCCHMGGCSSTHFLDPFNWMEFITSQNKSYRPYLVCLT